MRLLITQTRGIPYFMDAIHVTLVILYLLTIITNVHSLRFHIQPNTKRCLKEEMRKNALVTGEYELTDAPGQRTDLQITDSKGHTAFARESIDKGKFAVIADEDDIYDICFVSYQHHGQVHQTREIHLELKQGVEAKSYEEVNNDSTIFGYP